MPGPFHGTRDQLRGADTSVSAGVSYGECLTGLVVRGPFGFQVFDGAVEFGVGVQLAGGEHPEADEGEGGGGDLVDEELDGGVHVL